MPQLDGGGMPTASNSHGPVREKKVGAFSKKNVGSKAYPNINRHQAILDGVRYCTSRIPA
jgi:hypothetical protein